MDSLMKVGEHARVVSGQMGESLWFRALPRCGWTEYLLGGLPADAGCPARWAADLARFIRETGAVVVEVDAFGDAVVLAGLRSTLEKVLGEGFPMSIMTGVGNDSPIAGGLLVRAVAGVEVIPVADGGRTIGFRFEDASAWHCVLGGVVSNKNNASGADQTLEVMETLRSGLGAAGMTFRDVARTWYYLDGILAWYDEFNRARTGFFNQHDVFSRMMPASTGIGIGNDGRGMVLAKAHASRVKPAGDWAVRVADSPLQGSAYDYGSAFSRAVEITTAGGRSLHISGTASIALGGETVHLGDVRAQIELTMRVVAGILRAADMSWADAVRGIAYFRNAEDLSRWQAVSAACGLPPGLVVALCADVCRDDLLFELELEAFRS